MLRTSISHNLHSDHMHCRGEVMVCCDSHEPLLFGDRCEELVLLKRCTEQHSDNRGYDDHGDGGDYVQVRVAEGVAKLGKHTLIRFITLPPDRRPRVTSL